MKFLLFAFLFWPMTTHAGTELTAKVESTSHPDAWANVDVWVDHGFLKIHFEGPYTRGSLIYNSFNSDLILVDDLNRMVLTIGSGTQSAFKMVEGLAGYGLKGQIQSARPSVRMAYHLAEANAQALFNGKLIVERSKTTMDQFPCEMDEASQGGIKLREVWLTSCDYLGIAAADQQTLRQWAQNMVQFLVPELKELGADPSDFLQAANGNRIPTHLVLYDKGHISARFKVLGIQPKGFSPESFVPPADYQKVGLFDLLGR